MMTRQEALDLFRSDDLIAIGMEADAVRRRWHPEGVVSYIIDRNINYTNFCTEYCSFCAFYRPMGHAEGYVLPNETIYDKIRETLDLGGTGVLMQGGLHPDLKIDYIPFFGGRTHPGSHPSGWARSFRRCVPSGTSRRSPPPAPSPLTKDEARGYRQVSAGCPSGRTGI